MSCNNIYLKCQPKCLKQTHFFRSQSIMVGIKINHVNWNRILFVWPEAPNGMTFVWRIFILLPIFVCALYVLSISIMPNVRAILNPPSMVSSSLLPRFLAANIYYHLIAFNISTLNHVKIIITFVRSFPLTISSFIFQINFHTCSTL